MTNNTKNEKEPNMPPRKRLSRSAPRPIKTVDEQTVWRATYTSPDNFGDQVMHIKFKGETNLNNFLAQFKPAYGYPSRAKLISLTKVIDDHLTETPF